MTWKAVKSSNPLKKKIMKAIREKTGIRAKITNVKENEDSVCGDVMVYNGICYNKMGTIVLPKTDLEEEQ
jgi:hypothetical protein